MIEGYLRTGAGKSSVVGALLRLTEIEAGQILIDSMDIRNVRLARLRSAVSVVPQSAFLFEVASSLDPHSCRRHMPELSSGSHAQVKREARRSSFLCQ